MWRSGWSRRSSSPITRRSPGSSSATSARWRTVRLGLGFCARAGLVGGAVVAIDGTKVHANASRDATLITSRSRGRSSRRRSRPTPPRMSSTARRAAMSFRQRSRPARAGRSGCVRRNVRLMSDARASSGRSPARARSGSRSQSAGSRSSCGRSAGRTRPTRPSTRAGSMRNGRRMGPATTPKPYTPPEHPQEKINTTDLDSPAGEGDGRLAAGLQRAGRYQ